MLFERVACMFFENVLVGSVTVTVSGSVRLYGIGLSFQLPWIVTGGKMRLRSRFSLWKVLFFLPSQMSFIKR